MEMESCYLKTHVVLEKRVDIGINQSSVWSEEGERRVNFWKVAKKL